MKTRLLSIFASLFCFALLLSLLLFLAVSGRAQTFGGGTLIYGISNSPCNNGLIPITNTFFVTLPSKTLTASQIANTNEVLSGNFYLSLPGYTNQALGLTNLYFLGGFTNSFLSGTNGGSWSTNFPGGFVALPFPLWMGINTSSNIWTNLVYVP